MLPNKRFPTKPVPMDYRVCAANASVIPRGFFHVFPHPAAECEAMNEVSTLPTSYISVR